MTEAVQKIEITFTEANNLTLTGIFIRKDDGVFNRIIHGVDNFQINDIGENKQYVFFTNIPTGESFLNIDYKPILYMRDELMKFKPSKLIIKTIEGGFLWVFRKNIMDSIKIYTPSYGKSGYYTDQADLFYLTLYDDEIYDGSTIHRLEGYYDLSDYKWEMERQKKSKKYNKKNYE